MLNFVAYGGNVWAGGSLWGVSVISPLNGKPKTHIFFGQKGEKPKKSRKAPAYLNSGSPPVQSLPSGLLSSLCFLGQFQVHVNN